MSNRQVELQNSMVGTGEMCWLNKRNKKRYIRVEAPPRNILGQLTAGGSSNQVLFSRSCGRKGCNCDLYDDDFPSGKKFTCSLCTKNIFKFLSCLNAKLLLFFFFASLILLILAIGGAEYGATQFVYKKIALSKGSLLDESWRSGKPPLLYKAYIFNITNPLEFSKGARPRVIERGPYVYKLEERREQVVYNDNGTVTYRGRPFYTFQPHLSIGPEEDVVMTMNVPLINAGEKIRGNVIKHSVFQIASKVNYFKSLVEVSVGKLLWGHRNEVLDWARSFSNVPYPYKEFGLMMGRNDTLQPPYNINTGQNNVYEIKTVHKYNNSDFLNVWNGDFCNEIKGTDMSGFHPKINKNEVLHIFNGQLCRSLPLVYNETVYHGDMETYRFIIPPGTFAYGAQRSRNRCFCGKNGCPLRGILDMKPCYFGAAVAFSFPHFYQGHPQLRHMVLGLR